MINMYEIVPVRNLTLLLVVSATVLAIILGFFITAGISRNIGGREGGNCGKHCVKAGESVENTADAFENMNQFLKSVTDEMERLSVKVEEMNNERRITLSAIRSISELSGELVHFSEQMKESLHLQVDAAGMLTAQADLLKENMTTLEKAVQTFKVE